jgi:hypothetical protein
MVAAIQSIIFGVCALFDEIVLHSNPIAVRFPDLGFSPAFTRELLVVVAILLSIIPLATYLSLTRIIFISRSRQHIPSTIDSWRRMMWTGAILETIGAVLLTFNGSLYFIPSAVSLLLIGVAELAAIWQALEDHAWNVPHLPHGKR